MPAEAVTKVQKVNYRIIPYDKKYRDDMIFMVLEAKNALGRIPRLNEDLLDIPKKLSAYRRYVLACN